MTLSPSESRAARKQLGQSQRGLARALWLKSGDRQVRRFEQGTREVPGPVECLLRLYLAHPELMAEAEANLIGVTGELDGRCAGLPHAPAGTDAG